jgi:AraC-like DNA-binding protein
VRPDYWQEVVGATLCPLELRLTDPRDVPDRLLVGDVGSVRVGELTAARAGTAERTRGHVRRSDPELCKIDVLAAGHAVIEQDGAQACLGPGDFAFVDLSRPVRWINAPARIVAVMFPRALLPLPSNDLKRLAGVRLPGDDGLGALVSMLARRLPQHLDDSDGAGGARVSAAVLDLLAAAVAVRLDSVERLPVESRQRALLVKVRAFIDAHLHDPDLTPQSIAAAQYISVRYLHRLFESEDATVADWIRRRRLELCRRDLRDPALADHPIGVIAARRGLTSAAHFSRLFRRAYGTTPTEYRALALEPLSR